MSAVAVSNGIGEGSVRIGCVEVEYEGLVFGNGKVSVRVEGGSQIGPAFDEVGYEDLNAEGDRSVAVGNPDGSLVTVVESCRLSVTRSREEN